MTLALLIMAVPQKANATVDQGTGSMVWQMMAAALIGSLFYLRRVGGWVRGRVSLRSPRTAGFLFASAFGAAMCPLTMQLFGSHPLPRFNDIFLVGIVLTAYLFTWESAVYLLAISVLVSAWVLPPSGRFWVDGFADWYRLASFTLLSVFMVRLITRMKARQAESVDHRQPNRGEMRSAVAGD